MTNEFEIKAKVDTKSDTEQDLKNAGDKIKAGTIALGKKIADPNKEKIIEKVD
jgi:hypothetical protein